jgi:uncharacterized protein (TIGR02246 family)
MKLRHLLLLPVIGGLLFLSACSNPFASTTGGSSAPSAPPEIKAAIDQYVAKINAHDAAGAGEFYEDDPGFHWVENGQVTYETKLAAVTALTNFFSGFPESHFEAYEVKISMLADDAAVATFKFTQTIAANGQAALKMDGTMTLSMTDRDGDWKIVVGHRSAATFPH